MNARLLASLAVLASGCVNTVTETSTSGPGTKSVPQTDTPTAPAAENPQATAMPSVALVAARHDASMHEVVLSPEGGSALTLDVEGGVRLWPSFESDALPWTLPVEEPSWMSLAATESGFVAAFIDTSGGTHIARIYVTETGARWTTAFDLSPIDPMFEVHVLSGGTRILALGVDHRVRLWNTNGKILAELDEHGVIPWQLRIGHDAQGQTHAAVVQFAPVRMQRLEISDDALSLEGEPHTLAIDQSPNRNDIGMSADGRYATAMQKPLPKKGRFEIEVVDLHDGTRRMLVGESDTRFRPRVHPFADEIIAETGSGQALRLPLSAAVPWDSGTDRSTLVPVAAATISYDGSNEFSLMHTTARGGMHATAWGDAFRVQSVHGSSPTLMQGQPLAAYAVGLSPTGSTVAWGTGDEIIVESVDGTGETRRLAPTAGAPRLLAFAGEEHLVTLDNAGHVQVRQIETDTVLDTATIPVVWGIEHAGWRPEERGGHVVLASSRPSEPLQILAVEEGKLGSVQAVNSSERTSWPEGGKPRGWESTDWMAGLGHEMAALHLRPVEIFGTAPTSTGDRSVVLQKHRSVFTSRDAHLTMIDTERNARVWVRRAQGLHGTSWSEDGTRFAYVDRTGGHVCGGDDGESVLDRRWAPRVSPPNGAP
ncbi:MAG: hypothetical protein ACRBN8_13205 [Nannocystales bacterium]